jgi:NAD(P)H-hydrate epimerase
MNDPGSDLPTLTRDQAIEVDRIMVDELGIELVQTMENAGRHFAQLARDRFLGGDAGGKRVTVLAGSGGNGGGAIVAARRLYGWGASVELVLVKPEDAFADVPARQLTIARAVGLSPTEAGAGGIQSDGPDVILDGIAGHGFAGNRPRGAVADAMRWARAQPTPILSLDVPAGMDATTGELASPAMKATATLALALPKKGALVFGAEEFVGELYLADIGVPELIYRKLGIEVGPLFSDSDLLRLR